MKIVLSLIWFLAAMSQIASAQNGNGTNSDVIPLIVMDDVPLTDAIKSLLRQADILYILDPRVPGSSLGPGRYKRPPSITIRWTNLTAQQALKQLLASNNLVMIENPTNPLVRIAPEKPGSRLIP